MYSENVKGAAQSAYGLGVGQLSRAAETPKMSEVMEAFEMMDKTIARLVECVDSIDRRTSSVRMPRPATNPQVAEQCYAGCSIEQAIAGRSQRIDAMADQLQAVLSELRI